MYHPFDLVGQTSFHVATPPLWASLPPKLGFWSWVSIVVNSLLGPKGKRRSRYPNNEPADEEADDALAS